MRSWFLPFLLVALFLATTVFCRTVSDHVIRPELLSDRDELSHHTDRALHMTESSPLLRRDDLKDLDHDQKRPTTTTSSTHRRKPHPTKNKPQKNKPAKATLKPTTTRHHHSKPTHSRKIKPTTRRHSGVGKPIMRHPSSTTKTNTKTKTTAKTTAKTTTKATTKATTTTTTKSHPTRSTTLKTTTHPHFTTNTSSGQSIQTSTITEASSLASPTVLAMTPKLAAAASATSTSANPDQPEVAQQDQKTPAASREVDARPTSSAAGVSVGLAAGCIAAVGLAGMVVHRRRQPENYENQGDLEAPMTHWRPQSFMVAVSGAVSKLPKRNNSTGLRSVLGTIRRAASWKSNKSKEDPVAYGIAVTTPTASSSPPPLPLAHSSVDHTFQDIDLRDNRP
ncbi:hypothetical protein DFQ30_003557 [Apophysomyces sp. BC1015]|nr:hypothetical protein DFQ30_003557 [Apophysomyces sp. BC1015]KAG0178998.1 hypothetical protein DFQ29_002740 [Apophysomyces sp. BC1021]